MRKLERIKGFARHYSGKGFLEKIVKYAKKAGIKLIYVGLLLYYTLDNPSLPKKLKALVMGSLGYFILPIDFIPDFIPIVGYTDDLGVLMAAIVVVALYIDGESKKKAKDKLVSIFGDIDEGILENIDKKIKEKA